MTSTAIPDRPPYPFQQIKPTRVIEMSDNLISRISEGSKVWISRSSLGRKDFSIDLAIEVDGKIQALIINSSFFGIDEIIWGNLYEDKTIYFPDEDVLEIEISKFSATVSRPSVDYVTSKEFLSIEEIIFTSTDGGTLKIFGDIDEFEVPCVNSAFTEK